MKQPNFFVLFTALVGAMILSIVADPMGGGLWSVVFAVALATIIEIVFFNDYPWEGLLTHIFGCLLFFTIMWLMALWPEPSDPNLAPWADPIERNFPFREFHYEVEQLHGELPIPEVDSAYLWWVLIAIPTIRAIIIQPMLLAHRQNKKD